MEIAHEHSLEPILRKIENWVNNRFMPVSSFAVLVGQLAGAFAKR